MRVFLTGATGFIGSFLAEALLAEGYEVHCLVRTSSNLRWLADLDVECHYGSLFDRDSLRSGLEETDYVIHAAGLTKAPCAEEYIKGNFEGTKNLIEVLLQTARPIKRFVLLSSQAAVGPSPTMEPVDEKSAPHPLTDYGQSKLMAEQFALQHKKELPITVVRPPAVYGPRDKDVLHLFKTIKKGIIPQFAGKASYLSIIFVKDLVQGILKAMTLKKAAGKIYFLANPKPYSLEEVARITLKILGKKGLRINFPSFVMDAAAIFSEGLGHLTGKPAVLNRQKALEMKQRFWICSPKRAKNDLNFETKTGLEEGIRSTLLWYNEQGWL